MGQHSILEQLTSHSKRADIAQTLSNYESTISLSNKKHRARYNLTHFLITVFELLFQLKVVLLPRMT